MRIFPSLRCMMGEHDHAVEREHVGHGLFRSKCVRCGRTMVRSQRTGKWTTYHDRDSRRHQEGRDELIGPVIFMLVLLALVVGFVLVRSGGI